MPQRERHFTDTPWTRRRQRSQVEGKGGGRELDLDTPKGAKIRQELVEKDVADLKRKWQLDMEMEPQPAGGGGAPTIFVAASDASSYSKALANYVCDGTDDDVEINAAQDELFQLSVDGGYPTPPTYVGDSFAPGGRVLLSEGTFHIQDGSIDDGLARHGYSSGPPNMTLQGLGKHATRIKQTGGSDFIVISYGAGYTLCDMTLDGSDAGTDEFSYGGMGAYFQSERCTVERVRFYMVGYQNYANVHLQDDYCRVQDCDFFDVQRNGGGVYFGGGANHGFAIGNLFYNIPVLAVHADGSKTVVANNSIEGSQSATSNTAAIEVGQNSVVVGNICESWGGWPATITSGAGSQVANNVLL